ncbi:hypothetical protein [Algoriphagus aquimarinus]|uniref:hypothetical protein n=1 Tax=Algoriphagus aquimarinus TaxID=237018 RepID=UPI0030DD3030|tara:strand:+ start:548 stop:808 length:261 start_codon:yes stop_codon:yes gene_type:complete
MDKKEPVKSINPLNQWKTIILVCLTLGLAPFIPEPHIWGKVKWVAGGAVGMQLMDWLDFLFHGFPWILLLRLVIITAKAKFKTKAP